jgi:hypothetical protein
VHGLMTVAIFTPGHCHTLTMIPGYYIARGGLELWTVHCDTWMTDSRRAVSGRI